MLKFLAIVLALPMAAQVTVQYSPEPAAVLKTVHLRGFVLVDIRACVGPNAPGTTLAAERLLMAAPPEFRLIGANRAQLVLQAGRKKDKKVIAAEITGWALMGGAALTGFGPIAATPKIVASLATAGVLANQVKTKLEGEAPTLEPFLSQLLSGPVTIAPGGCETRVVFAAASKGLKPTTVSIGAN